MGFNPLKEAKKTVKSVTKTVSKATRETGRAIKRASKNKFFRAGAAYLSGYGWLQNAYTGYAYLRGTKDAQNYYNLVTGHYERQQARIEKEMQRQQERIERQQREYSFQQRKAQIDEMRERIGVGGSRYRTNKQDRVAASSLWGSGRSGETLG